MRRVSSGAFASYVLQGELIDLSSQDRGFVTDLVYGTLRRGRYLDACLRPHLKRPDKLPEDVYAALKLGSYELLIRGTPRRAAVNEWVESIKKYGRLAGLVNAVLRKVEDVPDLSPAVRASVPDWLFEDWQALFGSQVVDIARGMLEPEPLWLTSYHPEAAASLQREGCEVAAGPLDNSLAVRPSKPLPNLEAYKKGWVQPQNPSSTVPARVLEVQEGERVLDLASGNGVKAAQLAATGAKVTSVELGKRKVERAKENLKRLGLEASHVVHDLRQVPALDPAPKVLLDAPCSGTGTLRGNPEIRQRITREAVDSLAALQLELLATAAALTQPGGTLVYAVCALTSWESIGVIKTFSKAHLNYSLEPFVTDLPHRRTAYGTYILPTGGLDGFFIARLTKPLPEDRRTEKDGGAS